MIGLTDDLFPPLLRRRMQKRDRSSKSWTIKINPSSHDGRIKNRARRDQRPSSDFKDRIKIRAGDHDRPHGRSVPSSSPRSDYGRRRSLYINRDHLRIDRSWTHQRSCPEEMSARGQISM
ncbi:unnamed protein product [Musa banksii]